MGGKMSVFSCFFPRQHGELTHIFRQYYVAVFDHRYTQRCHRQSWPLSRQRGHSRRRTPCHRSHRSPGQLTCFRACGRRLRARSARWRLTLPQGAAARSASKQASKQALMGSRVLANPRLTDNWGRATTATPSWDPRGAQYPDLAPSQPQLLHSLSLLPSRPLSYHFVRPEWSPTSRQSPRGSRSGGLWLLFRRPMWRGVSAAALHHANTRTRLPKSC